ncbi:MAG: thaumatin family protein [Gammaproteobacteria bacterium]
MKKGFWIGIGLLIICNPIFATTPSMTYASQPAGAVYSLPATLSVYNAAPVPQNLCSPTISAGSEKATCTGVPVCKGSNVQTASFSCSVTTSCNNTVPASKDGGNCTLSLNVTKPSTLAASTPFSFAVSYGSYNTLLESNAFVINGAGPLPPANSYRTITFHNSCNSTIWFGSITGAAPTKNILTGGSIDCTGGNPGKQACVAAGGACYSRIDHPDACFSQACSSDSDCMTGASCYAATGKCYWNNPTPPAPNTSFQLTTGDTNTIKIPEYTSNGIGVVWSGAFGGRTGCTTGTCTSALCTAGGANAQGVCSLGVGFQQPATQAEPTFITYPTGTGPATPPSDAYDVTVINGANVPMSMYPTSTPLPGSGDPFNCGAAGYDVSVPTGASPDNTIGGSSWTVATNAPSVAYRYVVPTVASPEPCSVDTDCSSSSEYCGLSYDSIGSSKLAGTNNLVCGTFAGWFTADQVCGTNNNFTTAFGKGGASVYNFYCDTPLISPAPVGTMANLYQCNGNYANSCYSAGATDSCCGCVNWSSQGTALPVPSNYVSNCQAANSTWTGSFSPATQPQVYDTVLFLKQSCPSCYVYPFDDASSSFTCTNGTSSTNNTKDYTVEFCPGGAGNTGFQPPAH